LKSFTQYASAKASRFLRSDRLHRHRARAHPTAIIGTSLLAICQYMQWSTKATIRAALRVLTRVGWRQGWIVTAMRIVTKINSTQRYTLPYSTTLLMAATQRRRRRRRRRRGARVATVTMVATVATVAMVAG